MIAGYVPDDWEANVGKPRVLPQMPVHLSKMAGFLMWTYHCHGYYSGPMSFKN